VRTGDQNNLKSVQDLAGKTVIVTGGSTADHDLVNRLACAKLDSVTIQRTSSEEDAARKVVAGEAFAYGGGHGSIQYLIEKLGAGLAVAWVHCNEQEDCTETTEPFSFVVRHVSTGLLEALNAFIANPENKYPGPSDTGLKCCPPAL
jgi:ABC-type amino acid transport substrate-binding protein